MVNVEEKVNCIFWVAELASITGVRRKFTYHYWKEAFGAQKNLRISGNMRETPQKLMFGVHYQSFLS